MLSAESLAKGERLAVQARAAEQQLTEEREQQRIRGEHVIKKIVAVVEGGNLYRPVEGAENLCVKFMKKIPKQKL